MLFVAHAAYALSYNSAMYYKDLGFSNFTRWNAKLCVGFKAL